MRPLPPACPEVRALAVVLAFLATASLPVGDAGPGATVEPLPTALPTWLDEPTVAHLRAGRSVELPHVASVGGSGLPLSPGSWLFSPNWCTLNFVFRERATGALAIGTAGHCIREGQVAKELAIEVHPDGTTVGLLRTIGVGRASWGGGIGHDFALIEISPTYVPFVDPAIRGAHGPCGVYDGSLATGPSTWVPNTPFPLTAGGLPLVHVGHGAIVGTGGTIRAATGDEPRPDQIGTTHFAMHGAVGSGDSGSPVRLGAFDMDGVLGLSAVGILTHGVVIEDVPAGHAFGTAMPEILRLVGPSWELVDDRACALLDP